MALERALQSLFDLIQRQLHIVVRQLRSCYALEVRRLDFAQYPQSPRRSDNDDLGDPAVLNALLQMMGDSPEEIAFFDQVGIAIVHSSLAAACAAKRAPRRIARYSTRTMHSVFDDLPRFELWIDRVPHVLQEERFLCVANKQPNVVMEPGPLDTVTRLSAR